MNKVKANLAADKDGVYLKLSVDIVVRDFIRFARYVQVWA